MPQRQEKKTGREQKVRVNKGLRGQKKRPLPRQKARDAARPRVPVTLWLTNKPSKTQKRRGPTLRARGAPLALTRARGGRDHPLPTSARSPTRAEKVCSRKTKQNKRGKRKTRQEKHKKTLAASRPKKKASEGSRRIPKTRGAQNGTPRKTPRSGTHGQNGRNNKRGGTQKREKEKAKQVRVRGCPVTT